MLNLKSEDSDGIHNLHPCPSGCVPGISVGGALSWVQPWAGWAAAVHFLSKGWVPESL